MEEEPIYAARSSQQELKGHKLGEWLEEAQPRSRAVHKPLGQEKSSSAPCNKHHVPNDLQLTQMWKCSAEALVWGVSLQQETKEMYLHLFACAGKGGMVSKGFPAAEMPSWF